MDRSVEARSGPSDRPSDIWSFQPRAARLPSSGEHVTDPASNKLPFFPVRAAVKADIVRNLCGTFQNDDPIADLQRLADRMGDENGGLAGFLHQPDEFRAKPPSGPFVQRGERLVPQQGIRRWPKSTPPWNSPTQ